MRLVCGALAAQVVACSFTMRAPPAQPAVETAPDCTSSSTAPTVDALGAIGSTVAFIVLLTQVFRSRCGAMDINGGTECTWVYPTTAGAAVAAGGFGYSSYRGSRIHNECTAAIAAHDQWLAGTQPPPTAPKAPAPPPTDHTARNGLILLGVVGGVVGIAAIGAELSTFHL